jgi:hypothetical protein
MHELHEKHQAVLVAADDYWVAMNRYYDLIRPDEQAPNEIREAVRQLQPAAAAYSRALNELLGALRRAGQEKPIPSVMNVLIDLHLTMRDIKKKYPED